jgi:hypothetical protein
MRMVFYSESLPERSSPFDTTNLTGNGPVAFTYNTQQTNVRKYLGVSRILLEPAMPLFDWHGILKQFFMELIGIIYCVLFRGVKMKSIVR